MKTTILFVALLAFLSTTEAGIGMGVLMIWPTARSTALAGSMTGLADEADATYFNPAGLAFQTVAKADIDYANWLPGLYQGTFHAYAAGGMPVRLPFLNGHNAFVGGSLTYLNLWETEIVNDSGDFLGRATIWRGAVGIHAAVTIAPQLGLGVSFKVLRSEYYADPYGWMMFSRPELGTENGGTATGVAADVGLLFRPSGRISVGLSVVNIGPHLLYPALWKGAADDTAELPRMARLGLCWTPVESRSVRLRVMPELDKVLVGMSDDTTGKSFGRQLTEEWNDVWKAVGVEATAFNVVSFRLGYFEDLTNQRGGLVYEKDRWNTEHYGLWDVVSRRNLGRFERIGLCWGFGIGYKDYLRFDVSSDAAIYDFPTKNWKLSLVANDIVAGIRELRQGHEPWKE